jgi:hypothetical protein
VTDDAWDTFIASLNPFTIEQERIRPPLDPELERPGGAEDNRMRSRHNEVVAAYYMQQTGDLTGPFAPLEALEARLERDREAQIKAYAMRHKRKAA